MLRNELNKIFKTLDFKAHEIANELDRLHGGYDYSIGWYNGHYFKNEEGEYQMDFFPIPVISINNICDIEISLDGISISTKMKRKDALTYDYCTLRNLKFEAYGVCDYLADYYTEEMTVEKMLDNIQESKEEEIGFSFSFDKNINSNKVYKLVSFLYSQGFYY